MTRRDPQVLALASVEAAFPAAQSEVRALVAELFAGAGLPLDELLTVFDNAGIERRTLAAPLEQYIELPGFAARNAAFRATALELLETAARRVLTPEIAGQVTHVITISSTGLATPTLECALIPRLGLPFGVRRIPLFGLGCAGGVAGLQLARDLVQGSPERVVLLCCVELTSLTYFGRDLSRQNLVACALFGDGAAAALIGSGAVDAEPRIVLGGGASTLFPATEDLMGWDFRDEGWAVVFSPRIPALVAREIGRLADLVADRDALRHYALHPGGRRILDAYESALGLDAAAMGPSIDTLRRHGNMSAATIFFVLEKLIARPSLAPGPGLVTAFGPGFSAEVLGIEIGAAAAEAGSGTRAPQP